MLPDYLQQGLGFSPPAGHVPDFGGLHPSVAQALGLAGPPPVPVQPPPLEPVAPEPQPLQLPSAAAQPQQQPEPSKDFTVPAAAIDGPGTPAPRPAVQQPQRPVNPPTSDQLAVQAQQKQDVADEAQLGAVRESETAQRAQAADEQQVLAAHDERVKQLEQEQSAIRDDAAKVRAQKEAYVQSTLAAVDSYKIDQNKFMNEMGMGQAVGWGIGAALATIGDSLRGQKGSNPVIQMMQDKAAQAIRAQLDERDQLKERAGRAGHALDRYDAFTKDKEAVFQMRMAEFERSLGNQFRLTASKYKDANIQAGADAEAAKLYQSSADRAVKAVDSAATREHQQNSIAIQRGHLAISQREEQRKLAESKIAETVWAPEQLKALNPGMPVPPIGMTQKKYSEWLMTQKHGNEALTAARANNPAERLRELSVPGVVTTDGKPALLRDVADAKEIGRYKSTAESMVRATDELISLVKNHGYEPNFLKSEAWLKARATYSDLLIQTKEFDKLGVLTGPDIGVLEKQIGTSDPTEFRNIVPGLENFRHHTVENFNAKLRNNIVVPEGSKLARWEPVDPSTLPPPAETQEDIVRKVILGDQSKDPGATYNPDLKRFEPNVAGLDNPTVRAQAKLDTPEAIAPYQQRHSDEVAQKFPGVGQATRAILETTWSRLNSTDPAVRAQAKELLEAAKDASNDDVADYAKFLLAKKLTHTMTEESPGQSFGPPALSPDVLRQLGLGAR